jgi:hypothetical protein
MTTSNLVRLDTQSSQVPSTALNHDVVLAGATDRVGAYSRLKSWLRLPPMEAAASALAFRQAVETLPEEVQARVSEAEADALRHGFSFVDFRKLKDYALKAIEDPFVSAGLSEEPPSPYLIATMMALNE